MSEILRVLDTDHLSLHHRGHQLVRQRLLALPIARRFTTVITVEEQLRGRFAQIARAGNASEWVLAYRQFQQTLQDLLPLQILPFDDTAAEQFVRLKATIKQVGTQDLKIAAIALSVNAMLVTRNTVDFSRIPGLNIEDWTRP
ncbi:MAG: type II toxin-antitoxin system VapC family toxin [Acidobacteriota bacterium]|nr:type II toxin-antitoxin system VapC family toxin [Acidobacteriota bacterium]